ncbi:uncharacterized protein LOC110611372 [Manihot esculenta]|uniref:Uncharacterized protein n=2 Tax=Manihot esculenta TaxID=3983 RepID=A0ACB7IDG8_MANES|nr:uncharacterized protein LOC110611372 [Manihot esculenta]KAG8662938.1 hypothetical protein MANES_01G158600v8 [Manihot esculenta]
MVWWTGPARFSRVLLLGRLPSCCSGLQTIQPIIQAILRPKPLVDRPRSLSISRPDLLLWARLNLILLVKNTQDSRMPPSGEIANSKPRKKKSSTSRVSFIPLQGNNIQQAQGPLRTSQKVSKRSLKNKGSPLIQQQERSNSDSLPDSSTSENEYRALRRKYLLLEEESFGLGRELKTVEEDVKTLEDEKLALLDQLVVLEGLLDPSEVHCHEFVSL